MPDRVDQSQLSDQMIEVVLSCRDDLEGLKQRQIVSGDSGVVYYNTETPALWDYQETLTNVNARIKVSYAGDGSQAVPIVQSSSDIAVQFGNGPLIPLPNDFTVVSSGSNSVTVVHDLETTPPGGAVVQTWESRLRVTGTAKLFFKAHVFGTSPGTVSVARTA